MSKKKITGITPDDFARMADERGVKDNALFNSTLETYRVQLSVIKSIKEEIESEDPTVEKEYVKGSRNLYIHPAVKELPRHVDSLNKTAALLLSIIKEMGDSPKPKAGDAFDSFVSD